MFYSPSKVAAAVLGLLSIGLAAHPAAASEASPAPRSELRALLWPGSGTEARLDQRGRALTAAALKDRIVVVAFVSADCAITCVLRTMALDTVARGLPDALRERVIVLAIDTDPARDDAARLRAFAEGLVGSASRLRLLVADPAGTAALAATLRYPVSALPEPPPVVLLFDRRGAVAMTYGSDPLDAPRLLRDIAVLVTFGQGLDRPADAAAPDARF